MAKKKFPPIPLPLEPEIRAYHIKDIRKENKRRLKIFLSVSLVLAFSLVTAGLFGIRLHQPKTTPFPTPTAIPAPKPTVPADWPTYRNEEYGFEIRRPPYLIVKENKTLGKITSISFVSENDPNYLYFFIQKDFAGDWRAKKYKEEKIITDGVEGNLSLWLICDSETPEEWEKCYQQLNINNYDKATLHAWLEKDGERWDISYKVWKRGENDENKEFQRLSQILSTFKVLSQESCLKEGTNFSLDYQEAVKITEKSECLEQGQLKESDACNAPDSHCFCNENTGTWWIDLDINKPGCLPACVIDVVTKQATINWRCTGAIPE